MVDITNRMEEADISSGRYDMSVSPSKLMDTSFGDALTSFGNLVEGAAKVVDDTIKRNIQSDLFNAVDQADRELGVTERVAAEASIDAPEPIKENMNKMANYREAVAQGRMSETQFYNRMDSVIRQLRVKYPGYREEIDKLAGQVIGFDTANTIRKRMFAERDEAQTLAAKRTEEDSKFIQELAKVGGFTPLAAQAQMQINNQGYIDPDIKANLNNVYLSTLSLQGQRDQLAKQFTLNNASAENSTREIEQFSSQLQANDVNILATSFIPRGPNGQRQGLADIVNQARQPDASQENILYAKTMLDEEEAKALKKASDYYNTRIEGTDKTFGSFVPPDQRKYDAGLSFIRKMRNGLLGKEDMTEVEFTEYLMKFQSTKDAYKIYEENSDFRAVELVRQRLGNDALIPVFTIAGLREMGKQIQDVTKAQSKAAKTEVANAMIVGAAQNNTSFVQTIEKGRINESPITPKQYLEGLVEGQGRIVAIAKNKPEEAYRLFKAALGPNRSGQHMLYSFSPQDRVKVFSQLAAPEFSNFIRDKGTEQMKSEYSTWLRGAFEASFREDISNVRSLSAQDMIGYQLSYDPKSGFSLERESMAGSAFSDVTQSLAGNVWGVTQWRNSINRINEFMTTYRNALPESLTDKQQAEVLNEMIQSLGVGTEPSQAGGFWSQVANRVQNWITSGDSNVKVDPSSGVTTRAEFLGVDKAVGDLYEDKTNVDTAVKTAWGEGRGETPEGRIAIFEVLRNRALASGRSIDYEAKKGNGSQFNVWKEDDDNYKVVTSFNEKDPNYETTVQEFLTSANSDITKGATHYYNPDTSSPSWEKLFVETARIGKHRFGYLKKDDPYRKRLSKYRDRSEFD